MTRGIVMRLRPGGIDVFYIDESNDAQHYVMTAVAVPFLRPIDETWHIIWPDYLDAAKDWRRAVRTGLQIPTSKELHGLKLASGRGNYYKGKYQFDRTNARARYRQILEVAGLLPNDSVITIAAKRGGRTLFGMSR